MRRVLGFAIVAAALAAGACASSGPYWSREDQAAAARAELEERITRLEAQLAAATERNAALQSKVETLQQEVDRLRNPTAAAAPPPGASGPLPGLAPDPAPIGDERSRIEQSDLDEPAPGPGAPGADRAAPEEGPGQELYDRSLDALQQQRLTEAAAGFTRYLTAHGDSDLADNAQFWLAECALRRGDTAAALAGFRAVVERYPEGNKVPDALLKVGFCLAALGDPESAGEVYREILRRFPETAAAETARQRLGTP